MYVLNLKLSFFVGKDAPSPTHVIPAQSVVQPGDVQQPGTQPGAQSGAHQALMRPLPTRLIKPFGAATTKPLAVSTPQRPSTTVAIVPGNVAMVSPQGTPSLPRLPEDDPHETDMKMRREAPPGAEARHAADESEMKPQELDEEQTDLKQLQHEDEDQTQLKTPVVAAAKPVQQARPQVAAHTVAHQVTQASGGAISMPHTAMSAYNRRPLPARRRPEGHSKEFIEDPQPLTLMNTTGVTTTSRTASFMSEGDESSFSLNESDIEYLQAGGANSIDTSLPCSLSCPVLGLPGQLRMVAGIVISDALTPLQEHYLPALRSSNKNIVSLPEIDTSQID